MNDRIKILVVEDDQAIADVMVFVLEKHDYCVTHAKDGKQGLFLFQTVNPDLVLLDLNLPRLSGHGLFRQIRECEPEIPVIMVTCLSNDIDRITGLQMGADDYICKPFNNDELVARVRNLLRRSRPSPTPTTTLEHGPFRIDTINNLFYFHNHDIALTGPEFELMKTLINQPQRIFSRSELINQIYNDSHPVTDRSMDSCIKRIRRKIRMIANAPPPIRTIYGRGYQLGTDNTISP